MAFSLRPLRPLYLLLAAIGLQAPAPAQADVAGPYLAARIAGAQSDYRNAAAYYARALLADPANPFLQESALISYLGLGDFDRAKVVAGTMAGAGNESQIAALTLLAADAQAGDFAGGLARIDAGAEAGVLVTGLFRAWALAGQGDMSQAMRAFDTVIAESGLGAFGLYHKALALAMVGDYEGADAIFADKSGAPLRATRRGLLAHVQILSQLERPADALALLDQALGPDVDPEFAQARAALQAGAPLPFTIAPSARDGIAEVYLSVASALQGDTPEVFTLLHARLAEYLRPDLVDAILLGAAILEQQEQHDLATESYARVPQDHPSFPAAEIGRADALVAADRPDAAIEVLRQLTRTRPDLAGGWISLGDTLRRQESYSDAATAYDKAIDLLGEPRPAHWFVWYARAIAHERSGAWDKAEPGFRKALDLSPDQPAVLNYLGYSYVEKKQNLDEALSMIERAVAARPEDGYIIDSLGWVLYRLGRYDEAVVQMERAVELMAVDPLVNDHLGDVYWAVGRKREAEFQWKRAISFGPGEDLDMDRVRRKLEVGLDQVLREEGAEPLKPALSANGN